MEEVEDSMAGAWEDSTGAEEDFTAEVFRAQGTMAADAFTAAIVAAESRVGAGATDGAAGGAAGIGAIRVTAGDGDSDLVLVGRGGDGDGVTRMRIMATLLGTTHTRIMTRILALPATHVPAMVTGMTILPRQIPTQTPDTILRSPGELPRTEELVAQITGAVMLIPADPMLRFSRLIT